MAIDLLEINGINYRVEVNMNTVENWEKLSGKTMGQFEVEAAESAQNGGVATRAMLLWLFCAIIEGEELEGRTFELDFLEFKRMLRPLILTNFARIFLNQYLGKNTDQKEKTGEVENVSKTSQWFATLIKSRLLKWLAAVILLVCVALYFVRFS